MEIGLSELDEYLKRFVYPVDSAELAEACENVTIALAEGEMNLGEAIRDARGDRYDSEDDVVSSVHNVLPRRAVGEPFQSEGEG
ncbi:MAG: hypothetical protein ABEI39_01090 [Halobacteriales archaeon]